MIREASKTQSHLNQHAVPAFYQPGGLFGKTKIDSINSPKFSGKKIKKSWFAVVVNVAGDKTKISGSEEFQKAYKKKRFGKIHIGIGDGEKRTFKRDDVEVEVLDDKELIRLKDLVDDVIEANKAIRSLRSSKRADKPQDEKGKSTITASSNLNEIAGGWPK